MCELPWKSALTIYIKTNVSEVRMPYDSDIHQNFCWAFELQKLNSHILIILILLLFSCTLMANVMEVQHITVVSILLR
jgi:hypothetical protein